MSLKIALPKGRLLEETASMLSRAGWGLDGYRKGARFYRFQSDAFPTLSGKLFHEKDIPIQVAIGNYDLGICGLDWIEELMVRYRSSALVRVKNLGYGDGILYAAASRFGAAPPSIERLKAASGAVRIASEYPNLAESVAVNLRLRRFGIFPLWGAAEAYPPDMAELALFPARTESDLLACGLVPVCSVLRFSAFLIANRTSWETKDMGDILSTLENGQPAAQKPPPSEEPAMVPQSTPRRSSRETARDTIRLALPDGHQQSPTADLLNRAGIPVDDYPSKSGNRRPATAMSGVSIRVIRPQDMPLQVASGNFDVAITGRDWLREHLYQFPSSPVAELLDLKHGRVKIVAVVAADSPAEDIDGLRKYYSERSEPVRVASEYMNIADKYARDNHLGIYKVVPTWGASEAFLPEDADLLIENTQTGSTLARHNLRIIDTIFESTACLIGNARLRDSRKSERIKSFVETLRAATEVPA